MSTRCPCGRWSAAVMASRMGCGGANVVSTAVTTSAMAISVDVERHRHMDCLRGGGWKATHAAVGGGWWGEGRLCSGGGAPFLHPRCRTRWLQKWCCGALHSCCAAESVRKPAAVRARTSQSAANHDQPNPHQQCCCGCSLAFLPGPPHDRLCSNPCAVATRPLSVQLSALAASRSQTPGRRSPPCSPLPPAPLPLRRFRGRRRAISACASSMPPSPWSPLASWTRPS